MSDRKRIYKLSMSNSFKISYYVSSLLPQYFMLMVLFIIGNCENRNFTLKNFFMPLNSVQYNFIFYMIIFLVICSLSSLIFVNKKIDETQNNSISFGTYKVKLSNRVNHGVREFFLSMLIPVIATFSILDHPISSMVMILLMQFILCIFYLVSSDIFPNISLLIVNKYVYEVASSKESSISNIGYVIGDNVKGINYREQLVNIIPLVPNNSDYKFAVIKKENKK